MEKNTRRSRNWLAHKWQSHTVRNCFVSSALRRMIEIWILCATMHCNVDISLISVISACSFPLTLHRRMSLIFALRSLVCCQHYIFSRCLFTMSLCLFIESIIDFNLIPFHSAFCLFFVPPPMLWLLCLCDGTVMTVSFNPFSRSAMDHARSFGLCTQSDAVWFKLPSLCTRFKVASSKHFLNMSQTKQHGNRQRTWHHSGCPFNIIIHQAISYSFT